MGSESLKVKAVAPVNKSQAEIEQELLDKDAENKAEKAKATEEKENAKKEEEVNKTTETAKAEEKKTEEDGKEEKSTEPVKLELTDDNVLSFINEQTGNSFSSVEEMLKKPEPQQVELDESVAAYKKYREETGRSIVDFAKLNKDYSKMSDDDKLRSYYADQNPTLDASDIEFMLNEEFGFDEEDDEQNTIQRKRIAKKTKIAEATKFLEDGREQYKGVLESTAPLVPEDQREAFTQWQEQQKQAGEQQEKARRQNQHFMKSTNELFSDGFEGFEYQIGDGKNIKYKVDNVDKVKESQLDTGNFVKKHLDDNGMLKDSNAFHKSMFAANDPDGFAKFFYELGASNALSGDIKDAKNIEMSANNANREHNREGIKAVDHSKSKTGTKRGGLKITPPTKT